MPLNGAVFWLPSCASFQSLCQIALRNLGRDRRKGSALTGWNGSALTLWGWGVVKAGSWRSRAALGTRDTSFSGPQLGPGCLLPNEDCLPRTQVPLAFNYNIRIIKLFCEHSLLLMQLPGALAFIERKVIIYCPLYVQSHLHYRPRTELSQGPAGLAGCLTRGLFPRSPLAPSGTRRGWGAWGRGCSLMENPVRTPPLRQVAKEGKGDWAWLGVGSAEGRGRVPT